MSEEGSADPDHVELPAIQANVVVTPKETGPIKAKAIGDHMVQLSATARDCTSLGLMMDVEQARELIGSLEDAIARADELEDEK